MRCDDLEPLIEAIADGTLEPGADDRGAPRDVRAVPVARGGGAGRSSSLLAAREAPAPPAAFTAGVMARVGRERWQTERVFDLGFNLAIAAGAAADPRRRRGPGVVAGVPHASPSTSARSLDAAGSEVGGRVLSQVQTIAMAAVLLTMALVLWWWAEADRD